MASLQFRNSVYSLLFRFNDKQHTLNIGEVPLAEARQWKFRAETLLMQVKQRLLEVPASVPVAGPIVPRKASMREERSTSKRRSLVEAIKPSRPPIHLNIEREFVQETKSVNR